MVNISVGFQLARGAPVCRAGGNRQPGFRRGLVTDHQMYNHSSKILLLGDILNFKRLFAFFLNIRNLSIFSTFWRTRPAVENKGLVEHES